MSTTTRPEPAIDAGRPVPGPSAASTGGHAARLWAVTRTGVLRFLRDRSNVFFVFVFPLALVFLLGQQFADTGDTPFGVVPGDGAVAEGLADDLAGLDELAVSNHVDADALADAVARGDVLAGVDLSDTDEDAEVAFVARPDGGAGLRALVDGVVTRRASSLTATEVVRQLEPTVDVAVAAALLADDPDLGVAVATRAVGELTGLDAEFAGLGQFDLTASTQLLLFMFVTSLSGSAALIQSRQLGVTRRMLSTPTTTATVLVGEAGGRFAVALVQAVWIVLGTVLLFGVDWGDPFAAGLVVALFAAVCAGAAMLMGSVFRNDAQAGGAGVGLGLGLSALGGSMIPVEVFPENVSWVVHLTPHGPANAAFAELVRRDASVRRRRAAAGRAGALGGRPADGGDVRAAPLDPAGVSADVRCVGRCPVRRPCLRSLADRRRRTSPVASLLTTLHQLSGYVLFAGMLVLAVVGFVQAARQAAFDARGFRVVAWLVTLQLVIGIGTYVATSAWDRGLAVAVLHPVLMVLATGMAHGASAKGTRLGAAGTGPAEADAAWKGASTNLAISVVLVVAGIGVASAA